MEMLQLNDLHKTFNPGTVNEKVALNGVSLHMEAGDFATIVGSNGAGKSTLFNAITGGFIADEGSILLGGQDITFEPEHQRSKVIGHLFQDPLKGTAPNMTIEENLALAYLRAGTAPHAIFSRISRKDKELVPREALSAGHGPGGPHETAGGLLSGGQRQRLALARALLHDSPVYIFDEATSNIDVESEIDIMAGIHRLAGRKTVILISHRLANVTKADNIYVLDHGHPAGQGTHEALLAQGGLYADLWNHQQTLENYGKEAQ